MTKLKVWFNNLNEPERIIVSGAVASFFGLLLMPPFITFFKWWFGVWL